MKSFTLAAALLFSVASATTAGDFDKALRKAGHEPVDCRLVLGFRVSGTLTCAVTDASAKDKSLKQIFNEISVYAQASGWQALPLNPVDKKNYRLRLKRGDTKVGLTFYGNFIIVDDSWTALRYSR